MELYNILRNGAPRQLKIYCSTCEKKIVEMKTPSGELNTECPEPTSNSVPVLTANTTVTLPLESELPVSKPSFASVVSAHRPPKAKKSSNVDSGSQEIQTLMKRVEMLETKITQTVVPQTLKKEEKRPPRDRCLILFNIPESGKESPSERIIEDCKHLQSLVSKLFDPGENGLQIVTTYRLGRRVTETEQPRPLKVVLESQEECKRVFSRVHRLKGDRLHIQRDLSPEDREKMRLALQELRRRREDGETDLRIVNFRVVRRQPRISWKPLILYPVAPEVQD